MKLKKILAGAMAGAMVLGSVTGVSAATPTSVADYTFTTFAVGNTGYVTLSGDFDVTYTFHDVCNGTNNWDNYTIEMNNDNGVYIDVRSDNAGWLAYQTDGATLTEDTDWTADWATSFTWETWLAAMQAGADCTVNIVRVGNTFTVTNTSAGATFIHSTTATDFEGCDVNLYITGENCTISNVAFTDYTGVTVTDSDTIAMTVDQTKSAADYISVRPSSLSTSDVTYAVTSGSDVVSVAKDGTITPSKKGTATITATYSGSATVANTTAVLTVNVTDPNSVTGITSSVSAATLTVGNSLTLSGTPVAEKSDSDITDDYTITYTSSDTSIASVDATTGVVTALAAGTATITINVAGKDSNDKAYSYDATVTLTVEAAAATTTTTESTEDATTEEETETETEETVTTVEESETMKISTFWTTFTSGYEVTEDTLTLTLTTTNNGTSNWENVIWVLYSSDSGYLCTSGADSTAATEDNYIEYYVGRADAYGWDGASAVGTATMEATYSDDFDWDTWLAATQAGAEVTITAVLDGDGNAIVTLECEGMSYTVTVPVDADSTIYLALTGENCTLSDLTVNGESANFPVLVQTAATEDTETEETETDTDTEDSTTTVSVSESISSSGDSTPPTGDASPIIPIAVAMIGCAAVVIAGKKRIA